MDQRDHQSGLDDLRAKVGNNEEWQGLAVMDGIVCQLTGSGQWAAQAQVPATGPAKDPFAD
jgi:hypothetical protein